MVRENALRGLLAGGTPLLGANLGLPSPDFAEFCGWLGFDWIFIDGEHGGIGIDRLPDLLRACDSAGRPALVRVPRNEDATILGFLEAGAQNLLVPHVNTAEDARRALRAARYAPEGIRGSGSGTRAARYGLFGGAEAIYAEANRQTLVFPLIEDIEAVRNLDAILATPGVEAIYIGPGDLALSMGLPGTPGHPAVQAHVRDIVRRARAAGKWVGTLSLGADYVHELHAAGAQMFLVSVLGILAPAARAYFATARGGTS